MKRKTVILVSIGLAAVGLAVWYFKFRKPKEVKQAPVVTTKIPMVDKVVSAATLLKKDPAPVMLAAPMPVKTASSPVVTPFTTKTTYLPQKTL